MRALTESAATNKPCPACRCPLVSGRAGDVVLACCETCGSVWLDREVFARVCRERETQAAMLVGPWMQPRQAGTSDQPADHRYRPCPVCAKLMNRSNFAKYSGLILDTCRDHGTFFDPRELPALVHFIQGGGMDRMRERERDELKEDERRLSALRRISPTSAAKGMDEFVFRESTLDALLRELFNR
jgi:Zn-finger nucleic acid-binding protein